LNEPSWGGWGVLTEKNEKAFPRSQLEKRKRKERKTKMKKKLKINENEKW